MRCSIPLRRYRAVGVLLLGNNAANHTSKPVMARVKVACVEGLDVVDPLVAGALLIACEECVDACVGKQSDVVIMNNFSQSQRSENFQSVCLCSPNGDSPNVLVVQTSL